MPREAAPSLPSAKDVSAEGLVFILNTTEWFVDSHCLLGRRVFVNSVTINSI